MRYGLKLTWFKKIMLFFLIVVVIPTVSISSMYIYNYTSELQDKYNKQLDTDVHNFSSQLQLLINQIDGLSLQLSLQTNLNSLLSSPESAGKYDYYVLQNYLRDQTSVNGITDSAYIYFQLSDRVLTTNEGMYDLKSFYDKSLLDGFLTGDSRPEYQVRELKRDPSRPPVEVISFGRTLHSTGKYALGELVINVKKDEFFEAFKKIVQLDEQSGVFIVDLKNGRTLFRSGEGSGAEAVADVLAQSASLKQGQTATVKSNGRKYFINYQTIQPHSWMLAKVMPYDSYEREAAARLKITVATNGVVIMIGFLLSYLFALAIYSPWREIVTRYQSIFRTATQNQSLDEYSFIRKGIDSILDENNQIKSAIDQVEPLVRHKLIYDLLNGSIPHNSWTSRLLEQNGIRFNSPYFTVCIVAPELKSSLKEGDTGREIHLFLFGLTENVFRTRMAAAGTLLDEDRYAFILGLPEEASAKYRDEAVVGAGLINETWRHILNELCRTVNETALTRFDRSLQFSFGNVCSDILDVQESHKHAKRGFKYKALLNKSDAVFFTNTTCKKTIPYPISLQKVLAEGIKSGNRKQTGEAISSLLQQYVHERKFPLDKVQQMIVILLSAVIHELIREGYELEELETEHVLRIDDCSNNVELETLLREYLGSIITRLEACSDQKSDNIYVARTIRFMEENYASNISIGDIAGEVGVSPNYLSRIFKAETGISPLEYLTRCRMEHGKRLLLDENRYALQEIGQQIGYHDVQSFIRFFKKHESVTPSVYRKSALSEGRRKGHILNDIQ
ncbi:AraC family transcriptional regulator [Paenibacillus filicis]|uniref:AraC family transcriptional regulator n=1 Tax=Paenibacillus gyeongsangnamensis TaxID=3388067 RepID=A0ABT4Q4C8_9BACL|nr:AraC family transcriptional regulator [Paenibacillus filicis]MCZ8511719.1 AraC family transcriptional regulator [Paenibacillus filicis]